MKDLEIKYDHGVMVIHLEEFLECRSISKVRKLVKVIQRSHTPELIEQMQQDVKEGVAGADAAARIAAKNTVNLTEKKKALERDIIMYKDMRSKFKKSQNGWDKYNKLLKRDREELKATKQVLSSETRTFSECIKNKVFYEKLLSEIFS